MNKKQLEEMIKRIIKEDYSYSGNVRYREIFKSSDVLKTVKLINSEIGEDPGYFFFADDDDVENFDNLWNTKKYPEALNFLAQNSDLTKFEMVRTFIADN